MGIAENIEILRSRIALAAQKANRKPEEITLLAAVKSIPLPAVLEALAAGITVIGENRIQEAQGRYQNIKEQFPQVKRHFIGHLQTNKVKLALEMFDVIQSVDSFHLAEEISKRAIKPVEIFIEVNTSGEESKFGVPPEKAGEFIGRIAGLPNLRVAGLMTVGDGTRECFKKLKQLRDKAKIADLKLSMGMSHDFALAIEEGSDIIRVGTGIFGTRGGY